MSNETNSPFTNLKEFCFCSSATWHFENNQVSSFHQLLDKKVGSGDIKLQVGNDFNLPWHLLKLLITRESPGFQPTKVHHNNLTTKKKAVILFWSQGYTKTPITFRKTSFNSMLKLKLLRFVFRQNFKICWDHSKGSSIGWIVVTLYIWYLPYGGVWRGRKSPVPSVRVAPLW